MSWNSWLARAALHEAGLHNGAANLDRATDAVAWLSVCRQRRCRAARPRNAPDDGSFARHGNDQTNRQSSGYAQPGTGRCFDQDCSGAQVGTSETKGEREVSIENTKGVKSAALSLLVLLLVISTARAQSGPRGQQLAQSDQERLERWQRMSPEQKQELRERFERWKNMPPAERSELQRKFDEWRRLSPEEKATARQNFERWQKLPPEQRQRLQERWRDWRNLPPERREELRRRLQAFRELPPEKRQELRQKLMERRERLPPEEKQQMREKMRERFQSLSPDEKREVRQKLKELKEHGSLEERKQYRERLREKLQSDKD